MFEQPLLPIAVQPVISYPREAEVGKTYLMTIDLQVVEGSEWQFEEEEYPIYCMVDSEPLFKCEAVGEPAIVLHRFGGTYGVVKLLLTASAQEMIGEAKITLVNGWGVPVRNIQLDTIRVVQTSTHAAKLIDRVGEGAPLYSDQQGVSPLPRNPYVVGRPVSPIEFIGRTSEIETAFNQILNRSNLAIWGGPGIGKSSFLELLASPKAWQLRGLDPSSAVIVLLSCLSITPFSAVSFWRKIMLLTKDALEKEPVLQTEVDKFLEQGNTTKDGLRLLLRYLGKQNKFLVLLVDDYDAALRSQEGYGDSDIAMFLSDCRNIASHARERQFLSMVVTSLRRLNELGPKLKPDGSPWYNHYLFQPLKPFLESEVTALLGGLPITPALQEEIRAITAGNPALVQIAGFLSYEGFQTGFLDVDAFIIDFQQATEDHFESVWNLSTTVEQALLMLLSIFNLSEEIHSNCFNLDTINVVVDRVLSRSEQELRSLKDHNIIKSQSGVERGHYQFSSSMMEWLVIRKIQNRDKETLKRDQGMFLNLTDAQSTEMLMNIIHELQLHKELMLSFSNWLERLSEALPTASVLLPLEKSGHLEPLTDAQQQLYDWLAEYIHQHQHSPSIRQMMAAMNLKSPAPVQSRLEHLREKGYLTWTEGQIRTLYLKPNPLFNLRIQGLVSATSLIELHVDGEAEYIDLSGFLNSSEYFALKVKGHGMIDALIDDEDFVIMQPLSSPKIIKDGEIVAARVDGKTAIAYFYLRGDKVILQPANSDKSLYPPIEVSANRVEIQGLLVAVWRGYSEENS